jgi:alkanesulfonate monooxygenase SsuD/methylene tetrahydromethanopterin reductase-like flavin-dependent oxidoreductase (luciferase family)
VNAMLTAIDRCRRLWRGEEPGLDLQPRPYRPGGPPIWLGGSGPRMLRRAKNSTAGCRSARRRPTMRRDWAACARPPSARVEIQTGSPQPPI